MSRMESFTSSVKVDRLSPEFTEDSDIKLWLSMGRMAFFFCLWMSMAIPVLLLIDFRF